MQRLRQFKNDIVFRFKVSLHCFFFLELKIFLKSKECFHTIDSFKITKAHWIATHKVWKCIETCKSSKSIDFIYPPLHMTLFYFFVPFCLEDFFFSKDFFFHWRIVCAQNLSIANSRRFYCFGFMFISSFFLNGCPFFFFYFSLDLSRIELNGVEKLCVRRVNKKVRRKQWNWQFNSDKF